MIDVFLKKENKLTDDEITEINPRDIANEHIIKDIIKKAFDILEHYYD